MKLTVEVDVEPVTYAQANGLASCAEVAGNAEMKIRAALAVTGVRVGRVRVVA